MESVLVVKVVFKRLAQTVPVGELVHRTPLTPREDIMHALGRLLEREQTELEVVAELDLLCPRLEHHVPPAQAWLRSLGGWAALVRAN